MTRHYAETVDMGDNKHPLPVDLYHDSKVGKVVSYVLRSFKTLNALNQNLPVDIRKGIEVYSAKLPQFNEKYRINCGFIEKSPYDKGVYWLVMDERLTDDEKLAVAFHEISHLVGGLNEDEKQTQKTAIDSLAKLARNYDELKKQGVSKELSEKSGVEYNISEMEKTDLGKALKYLIDTSPYFGIDQRELAQLGVAPLPKRKNLEDKLKILFLILGTYLILPIENITSNTILNNNLLSTNINPILGSILLLLSLVLFSYKKILFKRIK